MKSDFKKNNTVVFWDHVDIKTVFKHFSIKNLLFISELLHY